MLEGLLQIANERMAEAVRRISIRRGYKPSDFALVAFGGAGGQHACSLAEILDVQTVLVPADAGLLSAVGLGQARVERFAERQILEPLDGISGSLASILEELAGEAVESVVKEGVDRGRVAVRQRLLFMRLSGQESSLAVRVVEGEGLQESFYRSYADHYGYLPEDRTLEVESARVVASSAGSALELGASAGEGRGVEAEEADLQRAFISGSWQDVRTHDRDRLARGSEIEGPALVFEPHCATVVNAGWRGTVDAQGCLVLWRGGES